MSAVPSAGDARAPSFVDELVASVKEEPAVLGLCAFALTLPIHRVALFHVKASPVLAADFALSITWLLALFSVLRSKRWPKIDLLLIAPAIYLTTQLLSLVFAHKLEKGPILKLVGYAQMALLPWLMRHLIRKRTQVDAIAKTWLVGAVGAAIVGLLGLVTFYVAPSIGDKLMCGWGALMPQKVPRLCAPFNNPNMFLNYLTLSCGVGFYVWSRALRFSENGIRALVPWAILASFGVVSLFTLSAGVGGFALTGAVCLIAWRARHFGPNRLFTWALGGFAALLAVFFMGSMLATVQDAGYGDIHLGKRDIKLWDGTRPSIWMGNRWQESPITGVGYDEPASIVSDARCFKVTPEIAAAHGPVPTAPLPMDGHSIPLNVLAQSGFLGLTAFVAMMIVMLRGTIWGRKKLLVRPPVGTKLDDPNDAYLRAMLVASLVGGLLFHGIFGSFEEARHLWLLLGIGAALHRGFDETQQS